MRSSFEFSPAFCTEDRPTLAASLQTYIDLDVFPGPRFDLRQHLQSGKAQRGSSELLYDASQPCADKIPCNNPIFTVSRRERTLDQSGCSLPEILITEKEMAG